MTLLFHVFRARLSLWSLALIAPSVFAEPDLFGGFAAGWRDPWEEKRFFTKPTVYEVKNDGGRLVLHAASMASHAGLARRTTVEAPAAARLRWQWKVRDPLLTNRAERTRGGDDFAARVIVIFEESLWPLRTRALNYVWAAHLPAGSTHPSPYSSAVGMIVVRSGPDLAGKWTAEERDLLSDYRAFFGESARRISGIAVLVDTDNTGLAAEAWFSSLALESSPPPKL